MNGKILIANNLAEGVVQFLDAAGSLTDDIASAAVALDPESEVALLTAGKTAEAANILTGAELIGVTIMDGIPVPNHIRERIRAAGPTVAYAAA